MEGNKNCVGAANISVTAFPPSPSSSQCFSSNDWITFNIEKGEEWLRFDALVQSLSTSI